MGYLSIIIFILLYLCIFSYIQLGSLLRTFFSIIFFLGKDQRINQGDTFEIRIAFIKGLFQNQFTIFVLQFLQRCILLIEINIQDQSYWKTRLKNSKNCSVLNYVNFLTILKLLGNISKQSLVFVIYGENFLLP